MRMRGLLVAAVVLAALAGGLWWSNKRKEAEAKKPPVNPDTPTILSIRPDRVARIDIRQAGGSTALERRAGKWELTAPQPLTADLEPVGAMLSTLSALTAVRIVEEVPADLAQYGLASPPVQLKVTQKDGRIRQVFIGDETPTADGFYARVDGDPRVFMIAGYAKTTLDRSANDLRDKRLLTFDPGRLTRLELAAKGQSLEFGRSSQNEWQILRPKPLRADGGQVEELVRRLRDASMELPASEEEARKTAAAFAAGTLIAIAKVTGPAGTEQLTVRRDKDKNFYARSSVVEGIYRIAGDLGAGLDRGLEDFRNKKVFDFGWTDPARIEVRDGANQATYTRTGQRWMSGSRQMEPASMQMLVDKLRELAATGFPERGFTTAAIELAVTSEDGKRVERAALSRTGNDWFARRENEPTIYQLDAKAVQELQQAFAAVKEAPQPKKKK
ncbi:MAG: DUF4340 domain-containing protein [Bryobacteraceae bacterium]